MTCDSTCFLYAQNVLPSCKTAGVAYGKKMEGIRI